MPKYDTNKNKGRQEIYKINKKTAKEFKSDEYTDFWY